ncbi:hypothetical protein D3C86_1733930 [compost metagenome]
MVGISEIAHLHRLADLLPLGQLLFDELAKLGGGACGRTELRTFEPLHYIRHDGRLIHRVVELGDDGLWQVGRTDQAIEEVVTQVLEFLCAAFVEGGNIG